jgi:peptidoglycan/xylan/chitin deacetylase (PgdA/CDA1 family)
MHDKIGILADSQREFIQEIFEQIGLKDCFDFVQDDFKQFPSIIITNAESLNSDQQVMLEQHLAQGGGILLFIAGEGKLPWGIQASKVAKQGDAIVVRSSAKDIVGEVAGLRLPLWFVPAIALKKQAGALKTTEIACFYPQSAPSILALEYSGGRAIVCGFPLFKSLYQCASSPWPYGYGALIFLLRAMITWVCQGHIRLSFKYENPVAVFSFDMEYPIANRTMGKVVLRLPIPWSQGESIFITTHRLQRILPARQRISVSRTVSHSPQISTPLFRVYADLYFGNKKRLFHPRSILMLQCERSKGKHLVASSLPYFKRHLLQISDIFDHYGLRCTFFVPAVILEALSDKSFLQSLQSAGFEFALHSYFHDHYGNMDPEKIHHDLERSIRTFSQYNLMPLGSRCPGLSINAVQVQKLRELGLLYDSSLLEVYASYPLLPVKNPSSALPFYEVPISCNYYKDNFNLTNRINGVAARGGLLHLYAHDHEFHHLDPRGDILKGTLSKLQQHGFSVMTIRELLEDNG